ncbi:hypothetical protein D3C75_1381880 [compost metagenome]
MLADAVVMHHRAALPNRLFNDDFIKRIVVLIDLLFRFAVHHVVVVDEVHIGAVNVAVR